MCADDSQPPRQLGDREHVEARSCQPVGAVVMMGCPGRAGFKIMSVYTAKYKTVYTATFFKVAVCLRTPISQYPSHRPRGDISTTLDPQNRQEG